MEKGTYTVKELIDIFETIEDKNLPVFIYIADIEDANEDINEIGFVDTSISDRIDLNI